MRKYLTKFIAAFLTIGLQACYHPARTIEYPLPPPLKLEPVQVRTCAENKCVSESSPWRFITIKEALLNHESLVSRIKVLEAAPFFKKRPVDK